MLRPPVLRRTSCFVFVEFGVTMNSSAFGLTSARAVRSAKFRVTTSSSWSSTTSADWVS